MNAVPPIPDLDNRDKALDTSRSFIIQAPAGSGKTELLIQRFLGLLACVDAPEEVLAVTFTRKAAGEMRSRVIAALGHAENPTPPLQPHLRRSWELARAVLQDDRRQAWQLSRHPARLSISTIDAVNAWLAGRAPLGAGASAVRSITESPEALYQEAARAVLELLGAGGDAARNLAIVLRHLDNDTRRFERLIVAMLPKRDQWLRQVVSARGDRTGMERPLRDLTTQTLASAAACMDEHLRGELTALLSFAAGCLRSDERDSPLQVWAGQDTFPQAQPGQLARWQALAYALLTTSNGTWRRRVDVRLGFPPRSPEKARMEQLLADCAGNTLLRERLQEVQVIPGPGYTDSQWAVLQALIETLKLAAAELQLVFAARGTTDFSEVSSDALAALGSAAEPSELGLALDHRVRHVLVDEFQDTSLAQFELLQQLTAGWEPGDGRTLFLVGDPMQSIYRFRQAEVGIFMRVRDHGLGDVRPSFLQLQANFRSEPGVVDWVNAIFAQVFPPQDDPVRGSVQYARSQPVRAAGPNHDSGVTVHWLPAGNDNLEAERVVSIVAEAVRSAPRERVCILVRSRGHAGRIINALRAAGVAFVAPEIENLEHSSVAQDLLAVTRALLHPADRLAWIGVLRAPWCALSLVDLNRLLAGDRRRPVPDILRDSASGRTRVSPAGQMALDRLLPVVDRVERARGRRSLRDLVEGAWHDLAGPATIRDEAEMESAESFLSILETADAGGDCADLVALGTQMKRRKGSLGSGDPGVQVMTMHKAKGLEFDTVVLPGLARPPRSDDLPLLAWQDVITRKGQSATILAPMTATGARQDPLYTYLMRLERSKQGAESSRLLYVACTRARRRLHLLAEIQLAPEPAASAVTIRKPTAGSLLERLWPALAGEAGQQAGMLRTADVAGKAPVWIQPLIRRLPPGWKKPPPPESLPVEQEASTAGTTSLAYEWASNWAMHAGSVVHRWLKIIAEKGEMKVDRGRIDRLRPIFRGQLASLGTTESDLAPATDRVVQALSGAIEDARGRWLLFGSHSNAECELPLTLCVGNRFRNVVIDRTFVAEDGFRWLIDYKTATHEGGDLGAFLQLEAARHREQLRTYREALTAIGTEPVRSALYFPVLREFLEVDPEAVAGL